MSVVPVIVPAHTSVVVGAVSVTAFWLVTVAKVGITGAVVSLIVTLEVQLEVCPSASVTVRVTSWVVFLWVQLKVFGETVIEVMATSSLDPLFISVGNTVNCPLLFKDKVASLQIATGVDDFISITLKSSNVKPSKVSLYPCFRLLESVLNINRNLTKLDLLNSSELSDAFIKNSSRTHLFILFPSYNGSASGWNALSVVVFEAVVRVEE